MKELEVEVIKFNNKPIFVIEQTEEGNAFVFSFIVREVTRYTEETVNSKEELFFDGSIYLEGEITCDGYTHLYIKDEGYLFIRETKYWTYHIKLMKRLAEIAKEWKKGCARK